MGEIRGFVTRALGRTNQGMMGGTSGNAAISRNQVRATRADGSDIGVFSSVPAAQRAVERTVGGGLLSWFRADLNSQIESWRGESRDFFPGDLNPGNGQQLNPSGGLLNGGLWVRADKLVTLQPASPPPSTDKIITRWRSMDGSGSVIASADASVAANFDGGDNTTTGRPAAVFGDGDNYRTNISALSPTYSAFWAFSWTDFGRDEILFSVGADTNFGMRMTAGGELSYRSAAKSIEVAGSTDGQTFVIGMVQHATTCDCYLGDTLLGTLPAVTPAAGAVTISSDATSWVGQIFEGLIVPTDLNPNIVAKIQRYMLDRYDPD